ncbi:alpha-isopropylmalate synthase regulatory domain-containing protein [Zongyangia hominis]|uniref:2-isopropylmalate synthase LeuA allosteric (dimerisation) domain-containing protein n=1 Tax=Zongyangia hominis TaxID=2763677 RepID=A0A926IB41_9FIRM|nr:alpha-isopropylmalate synthase regulatory domain-containing protein [Zongyangia hominis]MBC8569730.1 hypothetical protein [Zongyangia hominis]
MDHKLTQSSPRYRLHSFIVNDGNIVAATAVVRLFVDGVEKEYVGRDENAVEAILRAIDKIVKLDVHMDSYRIDVHAQENGAISCHAQVKVRRGGRHYEGKSDGIDAIEAVIKAYLDALNQCG